jgi:hypothetical protein
MFRAFLFALALTPMFVQAQDSHFLRHTKSSCSARSIDRFYCPWFGGDQFRGPYFDLGCSVKCKNGQQAVCREATCEDNQSGEPIYSDCFCR